MTTKPIIRVCLVDDDEDCYVLTRDQLCESTNFSFDMTWISSFHEAVSLIPTSSFDVFLFDYQLGPDSGLDLLKLVIEKDIRTPVIMLTGQGDKDIDLKAMRQGAADYLVKGKNDSDSLERSIRYAVLQRKTLEELRSSRDSLVTTTQKLEHALSNINEELETARLVQKSLLPQQLEKIHGIDIAAEYVPNGIVGGDMYDIIPLDDNRIALLILDVCGHGVPAALITAMSKVSFSRAIRASSSPKDIFTQVNSELFRFMPDSRYVTAFLGILDLQNNTFTFSRAGHPPVAHVKKNSAEIEFLSTGAPLIGCFADSKFEEAIAIVESGDALIFYTDGLIESLSPQGTRFGIKDYEKEICESAHASAHKILSTISISLKGFCQDAAQDDDITVLVIKIS